MIGSKWSGGAYFEAEIMFDPDRVEVENGDWPAFYGLSSELLNDTDITPKGKRHFAEMDIMEYGFFNHTGQPADYRFFWQTMHDWYGTQSPYNGIANNNVSAVWAGPNADIRGWHKYGSLWVAGTPTNQGSVQAYCDSQPMGGPSYNGLVTYPYGKSDTIPPSSTTAYSIFDQTHFALVLQANSEAPITVRNVKVWQKI